MAKILIDIPDKTRENQIRVIPEEEGQRVKQKLEKDFRRCLKQYHPLRIPISCEYCSYVGEARWHCHNKQSSQYGLNVCPNEVCSKWGPNQGLLIYLHRRYFQNNI